MGQQHTIQERTVVNLQDALPDFEKGNEWARPSVGCAQPKSSSSSAAPAWASSPPSQGARLWSAGGTQPSKADIHHAGAHRPRSSRSGPSSPRSPTTPSSKNVRPSTAGAQMPQMMSGRDQRLTRLSTAQQSSPRTQGIDAATMSNMSPRPVSALGTLPASWTAVKSINHEHAATGPATQMHRDAQHLTVMRLVTCPPVPWLLELPGQFTASACAEWQLRTIMVATNGKEFNRDFNHPEEAKSFLVYYVDEILSTGATVDLQLQLPFVEVRRVRTKSKSRSKTNTNKMCLGASLKVKLQLVDDIVHASELRQNGGPPITTSQWGRSIDEAINRLFKNWVDRCPIHGDPQFLWELPSEHKEKKSSKEARADEDEMEVSVKLTLRVTRPSNVASNDLKVFVKWVQKCLAELVDLDSRGLKSQLRVEIDPDDPVCGKSRRVGLRSDLLAEAPKVPEQAFKGKDRRVGADRNNDFQKRSGSPDPVNNTFASNAADSELKLEVVFRSAELALVSEAMDSAPLPKLPDNGVKCRGDTKECGFAQLNTETHVAKKLSHRRPPGIPTGAAEEEPSLSNLYPGASLSFYSSGGSSGGPIILIENSPFTLTCTIPGKALARAKQALGSNPRPLLVLCPSSLGTVSSLSRAMVGSHVIYFLQEDWPPKEGGEANLQLFLPRVVRSERPMAAEFRVIFEASRTAAVADDGWRRCIQVGKALKCRLMAPPSPLSLLGALNAALMRHGISRNGLVAPPRSNGTTLLQLVRDEPPLAAEVHVLARAQLFQAIRVVDVALSGDAHLGVPAVPSFFEAPRVNNGSARGSVSLCRRHPQLKWMHFPTTTGASRYHILGSRGVGRSHIFVTYVPPDDDCDCQIVTTLDDMSSGEYTLRLQGVNQTGPGPFSPEIQVIYLSDVDYQKYVDRIGELLALGNEGGPLLKTELKEAINAGLDELDDVVVEANAVLELMKEVRPEDRAKEKLIAESKAKLVSQLQLKYLPAIDKALKRCIADGVPLDDPAIVQAQKISVELAEKKAKLANKANRKADQMKNATNFLQQMVAMRYADGIISAIEKCEALKMDLNNPVIVSAKKMADSLSSKEGVASDSKSIQEKLDSGLLMAVEKGQPAFVKSALGMQADVNAPADEKGRSCLQVAIACGYTEISITLAKKRADLTVSDDHLNTPLHLAAAMSEEKHKLVVKTLLQCSADTTKLNNEGRTALHMAAWANQAQHVDHLLKAKANAVTYDRKGMLPRSMVHGLKGAGAPPTAGKASEATRQAINKMLLQAEGVQENEGKDKEDKDDSDSDGDDPKPKASKGEGSDDDDDEAAEGEGDLED